MKTQYVTADELVDTLGVSKGKAYQIIRQLNEELAEQGYIKIRYIDLATGKWKVYDRQYEHGNPKRTYVLKQGDTSYRGYCIEHGVGVDTGRKLTANEQHDAIYAGLSDEAVVNLQLALFYGYQSGDDVNDLYQLRILVSSLIFFLLLQIMYLVLE